MKDYFNFAVQSIMHRKLRSWLTIIGVVIGIAAIVALISVSQGLGNAITEQFENLGSNKIYVMPEGIGFSQVRDTGTLTEDDVDVLDSLAEIDFVNAYLYDKTTVYYGKEDVFTGVTGFSSEEDPGKVFESQGLNLEQGRWLHKDEKGSVVIGNSLAHKTLDKEIFLNSKIEIDEEKYTVVGIMESLGNEEDDNNIYLNIDHARDIHGVEEGLSFIELVVQDELDIHEVSATVQDTLEDARDDDDFDILILEQILEQLGAILNIFQFVLGGIAAISLFVGGIGIMNSMYTNVLERKKEIGILKAVGASPKDITMIFIFEAGFIGLLGGLLGALLGVAISFAVGSAASNAGFVLLSIKVEYPIVIFGILFAFIVGMIAGYLPAREAARLLPVEAFRE